MKIGVTGATGFLGRYIVRELAADGHHCRCWHRPSSDRGGFEGLEDRIEWIPGELGDESAARSLVDGCDAVVHAALDRPGPRFMGAEGDLTTFAQRNIVGSIRLMEAARSADVGRFVFVSTCAVHDRILDDRPLDETHPLWPHSHYGAHKAALEKFVHSYGLGDGWTISAVRPTGIYGVARPIERSKWFDLVSAILRGERVECQRGGKEVHAVDVARAIVLLLAAEPSAVAGQSFNCYDRYVSQYDVATLAKELTGSSSEIAGGQTRPKHQIVTEKLRNLGMRFGGDELLRSTVHEMVVAARASAR